MPTKFKLRPLPVREQDIQTAILRYLRLDRRIAWAQRMNTGAYAIVVHDSTGREKRRRYVRYGFPGCSDILGQLITGHVLAIEVKRPDRIVITPDQKAFLKRVQDAGGCACIASSVQDVIAALDRFFGQEVRNGLLERAR